VAGELILIVEDNDKNLKLARDVLQYRGFRTLEAMTAADGIALAVEHRPDLVLMDIQLPDTDGISALRQLRTEAATRAIPVVAFTASVMQADRQRLAAAGFDGFLAKPIDVKVFADQVERYCSSTASEGRRNGG
jgi:two-component system, cell cycle response regulator DivK